MIRRIAVFKIGRDARTGRFIAVRNALERPSTTTVETLRVPLPPPWVPRRSARSRSLGKKGKTF